MVKKNNYKNQEEKTDAILEMVQFIMDNGATKDQLQATNDNLQSIDKRLTRVEALMVTKDYLDDKLADLKGDLTVLMRKEDTKVKWLVELLQKKKVISAEEVKQFAALEPFPQTL